MRGLKKSNQNQNRGARVVLFRKLEEEVVEYNVHGQELEEELVGEAVLDYNAHGQELDEELTVKEVDVQECLAQVKCLSSPALTVSLFSIASTAPPAVPHRTTQQLTT